jgi:hypothetical protein
MHFFYKKAKYWKTVDLHRRNMEQPVPRSLDVLKQGAVPPLARYVPPDAHAEEGAQAEEP